MSGLNPEPSDSSPGAEPSFVLVAAPAVRPLFQHVVDGVLKVVERVIGRVGQ